MSDALTPLRHAYGVEPVGAPVAPGDAGHSEQEALRGMRALLDTWPPSAPSAATLAAVEARAAQASAGLAAVRHVYLDAPAVPSAEAAVLAQTRAAVEQATTDRPSLRPTDAAVAAVLARAAEPAADALPAASPVEAALLDQSIQALDRLPMSRPDAAVVAAVEAHAAEASATLAAVRHVYLDAPAVASAEAEVLRQSRAAVERSLAARPQPRPSSGAVAAVLARAAEASGLEPEPAVEASPDELALLDQSLWALDRLPRVRPSDAALAAVRLAAATATSAPAPNAEDRPTRPADRSPALPLYRRAPAGVWAGAAAFLVAALAAVVVLPFGRATDEAPVTVATVTQEVEEAPAPLAPEPEPVDLDETAPTASAAAPSPLAAASTISSLVPAARKATRPPSPAASPAPSAPTPAWEAPDDVRTLSLRLQELDSDDALAWDDAPAEVFGVPSSPSVTVAPGVQAVRAGSAPARARLRTDSSSVQR